VSNNNNNSDKLLMSVKTKLESHLKKELTVDQNERLKELLTTSLKPFELNFFKKQNTEADDQIDTLAKLIQDDAVEEAKLDWKWAFKF
jgi:hypothetical protein